MEWYDPAGDRTLAAGTVEGLGRCTFEAPFAGDAVLHSSLPCEDR